MITIKWLLLVLEVELDNKPSLDELALGNIPKYTPLTRYLL